MKRKPKYYKAYRRNVCLVRPMRKGTAAQMAGKRNAKSKNSDVRYMLAEATRLQEKVAVHGTATLQPPIYI
ncbi:MAG: hypothetical protein VB112_03075 [Oscillospiraceae bacterium]|nr:hypothetical protein [Oscillospiraceae bacterium]